MKKLILGACLLSASTLGFAGDGEVKDRDGLYLYGSFTDMHFDKATLLDDTDALGLGLGWSFNKNWSIEGTYIEDDVRYGQNLLNTNNGSDILAYGLDVVYNWTSLSGTKTFPYFKLGAGKYDLQLGTDTPSVSAVDAVEGDVFYKGGVGLQHFFTDNFFARIGTEWTGGKKQQDHKNYYVNLGFFLGDSHRAAPAPVKAPVKAPADTDGDGVIDANDRCPGTPAGAKVDSYGCPVDSDGDGVFDYQDACPGTPAGAKVDSKGCRIQLEEKVVIDMRLNFDTNKAAIKPGMVDEISKVAEFLRQYPDVSANIQGHTDSVGKASYNKSLSQRRADSVVNYLVSNFGVAASRLSGTGYGEENPIADNGTAEGRAQNRRAEAHLETVVTK